MTKLKYLVIHCTDTPAGREIFKADIVQWHIKENGWSKVGYSDLIHLDGSITNLIEFDQDDTVDNWEISNGARGALIFNEAASGDPSVCVLDFGADKTSTAGDFTITFPTADASNAIIRIA